MADDEPKRGPIPAIVEPWLNLIHTVGLPWFIIAAICYYGIPYAKELLVTQSKIDDKFGELLDQQKTMIGTGSTTNRLLSQILKKHPEVAVTKPEEEQ
jgi:hypothetical protein